MFVHVCSRRTSWLSWKDRYFAELEKTCGFHCVSCESRAFIFIVGSCEDRSDSSGFEVTPQVNGFWWCDSNLVPNGPLVFSCSPMCSHFRRCILMYFYMLGLLAYSDNRDSHLHQSYLLCEWFELLISIFEDDYVHDMYSNYDYIYVWDCTCHYLRILYIYIYIYRYCR